MLSGKIWNGEPLEGKTLLFRCEGGYGDQILNFRFAKQFQEMGAIVLVYCSNNLIDIFSRHGFQCIDDMIPLEFYRPTITYDYWIPSLSAPFFLNLEYDDLDGSQYIFPDKIFELPNNSEKIKIGIRWSGNFVIGEENRRVPPEIMTSLCDIPNTKFYSLQKDNDLFDSDYSIVDMQNHMKSWDETANIIARLDLVITSCTSIAHLAGAMGIPTWVVIPIRPYYTWVVPGDTSKWYNSVKLFRQTVYGDYTEPIKKIRNELVNLINK
jgi:hypothetical protein